MIDLSVSIGNLKMKNPVMLASGVWDLDYTKIIDFNKMGGVIYKGVSLNPKEGNPPPRICEIPCGLINSIGLENEGIEFFNREILPEIKKYDTEIIVNIFGETVEEFAEITSKVKDVSAIEVNISCPNVSEGGIIFGRDPDMVYKITKAVCEGTELPVIVKLTPVTEALIETVECVIEAGADAITGFNTYPGMAIDIEKGKPMLPRKSGGVSGPCIKPLTLLKIYKILDSTDVQIIGSGGIYNWKDALEYLYLGVKAVQIGSAIFNNPLAPVDIINNINKYLIEKKCNSLDDLSKRGDIYE